MGRRLAALAVGISVIVALIVWYVAGYLQLLLAGAILGALSAPGRRAV